MVTVVITHIRGLVTPLKTTNESPSRVAVKQEPCITAAAPFQALPGTAEGRRKELVQPAKGTSSHRTCLLGLGFRVGQNPALS